jgi:hypothetical protein
MSVSDLFEWAERARTTDAETSIQAASEIRVSLAVRRGQFLDGLTRCGGSATAREAASQIDGGNIALHDSIRRRASDLARDGLIRETGSRICAVSGKRATVYERGGTLGVQTPLTTKTPGLVGCQAIFEQSTQKGCGS